MVVTVTLLLFLIPDAGFWIQVWKVYVWLGSRFSIKSVVSLLFMLVVIIAESFCFSSISVGKETLSSFKFNHASVQFASSAARVSFWLLGGGSVVSQEVKSKKANVKRQM